jgi:integrase/recombinase XerD
MKDAAHIDVTNAVEAYLLWMMEAGYSPSTVYHYERLLKHFVAFLTARKIDLESALTAATLEAFKQERALALSASAVKGLARYLYRQNKLSAPIEEPLPTIPAIYEQYLIHYRKTRQVGNDMVRLARRVITALCGYLEQQKIDLSTLKIDHLDAFLRSYQASYSASSRRYHRSCLRGFVGYLHREKNLLARDLAPMIVGAPVFGYENPPRFLNPGEIKRLFSSLSFSTPRDLRASAMLYLAYPLGLRPKEISCIRLDDIAFSKGKIALRDRKNTHPLQLPLPEDSLKAISAYIIGARPKSDKRALFLTLRAPYKELQPYSVSVEITACLRRANIPQTAYSLRHSYAQSLLEAGRSIFEIKEMLGHDRIQTTRRYLKIHVALMRKVLWDETL